jgi:transposase
MEDTTFLSRFLPDAIALQLDAWELNHTATLLTLHVTSTQTDAPCPVCAVLTRRVHSRYERILADLPCGTARVRKFVRGKMQCPRRIFTEWLPGVVTPWARWTQRLAALLIAIGLTRGGTAGVRPCQRLGLTVSHQTLLRVVRRLPLPCDSTPPVIGADDVAFRTHQTYGTVLIDWERRQPVALLRDREAETLAQWLRAHPGNGLMPSRLRRAASRAHI